MKTTLSVIAASLLSTTLIGCNGQENIRYGRITSNLSPELKGLAQRPVDIHNMKSVTKNQNARMLSDDLNRVFYLDHPSRLSGHPITYTSGQPR